MKSTRLALPHALSGSPWRARRELRSLLLAANWPGDVEAVVLAVHEAVMNAEQHAGGCTAALAGLDDRDVVVEVWDRGPGFDPHRYASRPPGTLADRGRGIWLISQLAARYRVDRAAGSTCVRLAFQP